MTPATFLRQRNRIDFRFPPGRKRKDATARLVRDAGAALVIISGKVVAYRLPSGVAVCVKRRYATSEQAVGDLVRIQAVAAGHIPQRAYQCSHCAGFHLTSEARR